MTGALTPINWLIKEYNDQMHLADYFERTKHIVPKRIKVVSKHSARKMLAMNILNGHRAVYFANTVDSIAGLIEYLKEKGVDERNIGVMYSKDEGDSHFSPELIAKKTRIMESLKDKEVIPSDVRLFITTTKCKKGINIRDTDKSVANTKPLSPKTVKDIHGVLHQALEQAVQNGELEKNPSNACKLPKVVKKEVKPLEESQVQSFLEMIEGHSHEYLYKITLFTGLREGEVLGLTWDCIDFKNGTLTVKQQLRKEQKKGGEYYFSTPKSGKARTLSLSTSVIQLFRYQQQKQILMKAECADSWLNTNLIFTNKCGDRLSYRTVYECFKRIARKMGRPDLRFHDLRHTYAVISIKNGDDIKTVQNNLGHATASFTLDVYGHVTEQMKRESSSRMEAFIQSLSASR